MVPLRNDSVQGVVQVQRDVGAGVLVDGQRAAGVQNKEVYGADTELGELRNLADELGGDDVAPPRPVRELHHLLNPVRSHVRGPLCLCPGRRTSPVGDRRADRRLAPVTRRRGCPDGRDPHATETMSASARPGSTTRNPHRGDVCWRPLCSERSELAFWRIKFYSGWGGRVRMEDQERENRIGCASKVLTA